NPYSPFGRGFDMPYDEETQLQYLDHLREWVDCFVVQDPEMATFLPEAEIIPRGIDLNEYGFVGAEQSGRRPLVVHAPSHKHLKGTEHVVQAVEELRRRRLRFDFVLIEDMEHAEARQVYERADVVIDQL